MKVLWPELWRIFKKSPWGILKVMGMDISEIVLSSLSPFIVGKCIDGLISGEYAWFYGLIAMQFLLIIVHFVNQRSDTRVYEQIIEDECNVYYEREIQANVDYSQISSRLNLKSEIPEFFETELVQIMNTVGGIGISLSFIFIYSGFALLLIATIMSVLVYFLTKKYYKKIGENNITLQDHDEKREEIICSRSNRKFRGFTRTIAQLRIENSDLDAKACLWTDILQVSFLSFVLLFTLYTGDCTPGQLFSVVTYTIDLNTHISDISEFRVSIYSLVDSVTRLVNEDER